jgi:hypothetical protein
MRRARFARAVEKAAAPPERASVNEALWFDVKSPDSTDEDSLLSWRIVSMDQSALLLAFTHLIAGGAFLWIHSTGGSSQLVLIGVPLVLVLLLDIAAALTLHFRDRWASSRTASCGGCAPISRPSVRCGHLSRPAGRSKCPPTGRPCRCC